MSVSEISEAPRWRRIGLWVLKVLLAVVFIGAGGAKLAGVQQMVDIFNTIGLGQWFRYLTGAIEVVGGVTLLFPALAGLAALVLAATMAGATLTHLTVLPASPLPAVVLLVLCLLVVFAHRDSIEVTVKSVLGQA